MTDIENKLQQATEDAMKWAKLDAKELVEKIKVVILRNEWLG